VRDKGSGKCYLSGGKIWYAADDPKGPWTSIPKPPAEVAKLVPKDTSATPAPAKPPRIVVATEPSELIASDGPPSWKPVGKGALTYIANTESHVVREVATGNVFVLISGRWYASPGELSGPWSVVRPDSLPAEFRYIPADSPLGPVRVSIAGTIEAQEAMLDAEVPQTAAIERDKASVEVKYDGEPQFQKIEGTAVEYAVNTQSQVLRIGGKYYACDQAVWFTSASAIGPWAVADSIPAAQIVQIPPSEPVYNVTHVTVYESTPEVVYVGYTPGYLYSYPWYGVPVYGTGWYYRPYVSPHAYYPRPVTYGMHVSYNPYTGWGGPGSSLGGARPSQLPANNLYKSPANRNRVAPASMQRSASLQKADRVAKGANNVYADKSGNVHRQTSQGWQSRSQGSWKSSSQNMSRDSQARKRGSDNYYGTGYSSTYPFAGGARRSYGGRRR